MEEPHGGPAVTLAEAALRLGGKTPQRVSQLLSEGALKGPNYVGRAPKNAARVFVWSLESYLIRRATGVAPDRSAALEEAASAPPGVTDARGAGYFEVERAALQARERSARTAALHLKIAADRTRESLEVEQARNQELAAENELLRRRLKQAEERAALDKATAQAYAESITPFLTPDDPYGLG